MTVTISNYCLGMASDDDILCRKGWRDKCILWRKRRRCWRRAGKADPECRWAKAPPRRSTCVPTAPTPPVSLPISETTCALTPKRSHLLALSVRTDLLQKTISPSICVHTQEKGHMPVPTVHIELFRKELWRIIYYLTTEQRQKLHSIKIRVYV